MTEGVADCTRSPNWDIQIPSAGAVVNMRKSSEGDRQCCSATVDDLATRFMKRSGAKTKTEAVRMAQTAQLAAEQARKLLFGRLEPLLKRAEELDAPDPDFDMKRFTDEMWDLR